MIIETLNLLWQKKKRSLGKRLQKGVSYLAEVLYPVGQENLYTQHIADDEIQWHDADGRTKVLFFYIADPRNLNDVTKSFQRTRDTQCDFSCIFVHQWTDGEGNWDVFGLHPQRGLVHWNRFWGNRWLAHDPGPYLKDQFYSLFACGQEFPLLSRRKWAKLMNESLSEAQSQLAILAGQRECVQDQNDNILRWRNHSGETEVLFSLYQDFPDLNDYLRLYKQIEKDNSPVAFLFQRAQPQIYDIFRFSKRSYMEHNNQLK